MSTSAQLRRKYLRRSDHKTLAIAALGGMLEVYDFIIFVFLALYLGPLFFPPDMPHWLSSLQGFGIFSAGYLARPLGGLLLAHYADRHGRKRAFSMSMLLMGLPCLLIGLMPTYDQIGYLAALILLLLRVLQGAAVGGEVPNAWVFVAEHVSAHRRGYALGILQAGLTLGYLLGTITVAQLTRHYSEQDMLAYAWRIPFLLGGVFALIGLMLRRLLAETPAFLAMRARPKTALPVSQVLSLHRHALIPAVLLSCTLTTIIVILVVVTPYLMQQHFGLAAERTFWLSSIGIACLNVGCVLAGACCDRIGVWRSTIIYSLLMPLGILTLYASLTYNTDWLAPAYAIAGLACGLVGTIPSVLVTLFPAALRVSGISLAYNTTYSLCASLSPLALIALTPWSVWVCVMFATLMATVSLMTALRHCRPHTQLVVAGLPDKAWQQAQNDLMRPRL